MALSDCRRLLAAMLLDLDSATVTDIYDRMLNAFGRGPEEPPVQIEGFTQLVMQFIYQAFDRLQDPARGTVSGSYVQQLHGQTIQRMATPTTSRHGTPERSRQPSRNSTPVLSPRPEQYLQDMLQLDDMQEVRSVFSQSERRSLAQGSHVSAAESWKGFCKEKQQRMRGRKAAESQGGNLESLQYRTFPSQAAGLAAQDDARSARSEASRQPEWQSAYSTSPPNSPPLGAAAAPEPEALDMPVEEFATFVISELQRATMHQRYHPGLGLIYRVGTGF